MEFPLFLGLMTSVLHVLAGPDHLAAVTPFAIESKKKAWKIGLFWGIGHLIGMFLIGGLFLFFKELIPVEKISEHSEQLVGWVLVFIGMASFYKIFQERKDHKHLHIHAENPTIHSHEHKHQYNPSHHHHHKKDKPQKLITSLGIGVLHGLAGVAHFVLFIPVLGFEDQSSAVLYIIGFGLGIIVAMVAYAFVVGQIADLSKGEHSRNFFNGIRLIGGIFAVIIGFYWIFSTNPG